MQADIDPVAQPRAYQELLFSLVGEDDPAEVQASTPDRVRALVAEAGRALRERPAPGEWSVLELAGHLADAEVVAAARYRWVLAHDRPRLAPYDQDLWVSRLHHQEADPQELVGLFAALRATNVSLWRRVPEPERERHGIHAERGPESYADIFRLMAGHDRFHLDQMERTLAAVRGEG